MNGDRDPVCGMALANGHIRGSYAGQEVPFCSELCRARFMLNPERYLPAVESDA